MTGNTSETPSGYFSGLSRNDVRRLARTMGLPVDEPDLDEVRFRLNALADALGQLDDEELAKADPLPFMREIEEG
ncbi:MAG: hypothetical protein ACE5JL_06670 [Dehalococcoidia bacterium]